MKLTTDRIVAIISGVIAAGGLSLSGVSSNDAASSRLDAASCRDLLQDQTTACTATLEQLAGQYSESMQILRDVCRDSR